MTQIFISYSRKNIETARSLAGNLAGAGFEVWWDISDLQGGAAWLHAISEAIDASQFCVVLLSQASVKSRWVENEYLRAINRGLTIIPLLIEACDIPFALANINYIDFTVGEHDANLNKLLVALKTSPLPPPPVTPLWKQKRFLWIGAAALLGIFLLIVMVRACRSLPPPTPTPVIESSPSPTQTATLSPMPTDRPTDTPTPSATMTATRQPSETPTSTETSTPSPTPEKFPRVELCVSEEIGALNVRIGPGTSFETLPMTLSGKDKDCPLFSARNEAGTWYMISPDQKENKFDAVEYGWVSAKNLEIFAPIFLPVATPIPTATRTPLPTFTPTPTATLTFTPTMTFTPTDTDTPIPTDTRMPTATEPPPTP